jgi:pyruvate dehydrogenase E2 component (dihydrolipoamide acetyltransferase)
MVESEYSLFLFKGAGGLDRFDGVPQKIRAIFGGKDKHKRLHYLRYGKGIEIAPTVNVGFAVAAPQGLVVPVIKDAQKKTLIEIAKDSQALTDKARSNKLTLIELEGACITLTNLGVYEIESFYAVSSPGQCSIVAVGQAMDAYVFKDGQLTDRKMMMITLSADYKVVTGTYAAAFLNYVIELLENPELLTVQN